MEAHRILPNGFVSIPLLTDLTAQGIRQALRGLCILYEAAKRNDCFINGLISVSSLVYAFAPSPFSWRQCALALNAQKYILLLKLRFDVSLSSATLNDQCRERQYRRAKRHLSVRRLRSSTNCRMDRSSLLGMKGTSPSLHRTSSTCV